MLIKLILKLAGNGKLQRKHSKTYLVTAKVPYSVWLSKFILFFRL